MNLNRLGPAKGGIPQEWEGTPFAGVLFCLWNRLLMSILKINGKERTFEDNKMPATIADLLQHLGVDSDIVVAELDGQIVERANFSKTRINDGQNIELVRFVGGG
jgi:sulfur carrier protein